MKYSLTRATSALVIGVAMMAPVAVSAQTVSATATGDVQAQIQALLAQIKGLQDQLKQLVQQQAHTVVTATGGFFGNASSTPGCPNIPRDLTMGSHGDDVRSLQSFLAQDPSIFPEATSTGFFGSATQRALKRFEDRFASSTETDATTTHAFDGHIRDLIEKHCGDMKGQHGRGPGDQGEKGDDHHGKPMMMGSSTMPMMGQGDDHGRGGPGPRPFITPSGLIQELHTILPGGFFDDHNGKLPPTGANASSTVGVENNEPEPRN